MASPNPALTSARTEAEYFDGLVTSEGDFNPLAESG